MGLSSPTKVNMHFLSISLLSGCCHGTEDEEAPSEQSLSVEAESQVGVSKAGPSIQKIHPCEMCVPILKDILHQAEH